MYKVTRTKNGKTNDIFNNLEIGEAEQKIMIACEDYGNGYIYNTVDEAIYSITDGKVVGNKGDWSIRAGDDTFNIENENENEIEN